MGEADRKVGEAVQKVCARFPFERYMDPNAGGYRTVASTLLKYLPPGASILDFGSGPCDKTAVAQALGFRLWAADDLQDDWHKADGYREKILQFAAQSGIKFLLIDDKRMPPVDEPFDMVMLHDVLEHLHDSPRELLNDLLSLVKPEGLLFVTVPNAVNIRKRLDVLRGRTNLPNFRGFYWYPGPWRGHIREYTRDDLVQLCEFLSLDIKELGTRHHMLHKLSPPFIPFYRAVTCLFPDWRDTWLLVARKKPGWTPKKSLSDEELRGMFGTDCPHYLFME